MFRSKQFLIVSVAVVGLLAGLSLVLLKTGKQEPESGLSEPVQKDGSETSPQVLGPTSTEDVINADINAQNLGDWSTFLSLRTAKSGLPESRDVWALLKEHQYNDFPEEDFLANINSARLVGVKALPATFRIPTIGEYIAKFGDARAFYVSIEYDLRRERNALFQGVNYRLYILAPESGQWVIVEASEAPLKELVDAGLEFGTTEEQEMLRVREEHR
jgi:hypothetical protein